MIEVIPAIDLIDGACVRLTQGDYATKRVYDANPVDVAKRYQDCGVRRLHLVDLDGAKAGAPQNLEVLEKISAATDLVVDYGGGLKCDQDLTAAFDAGATLVTVGSVAVKNRGLFLEWLDVFSPDNIILAADVRNGMIAASGWQEETEVSLDDFLESYAMSGLRHVLCTVIERDGMLSGPATDVYRGMMQRFPRIELIASGGVSKLEDFQLLNALGVPRVVVGKALYEGQISLSDLRDLYAQ